MKRKGPAALRREPGRAGPETGDAAYSVSVIIGLSSSESRSSPQSA